MYEFQGKPIEPATPELIFQDMQDKIEKVDEALKSTALSTVERKKLEKLKKQFTKLQNSTRKQL